MPAVDPLDGCSLEHLERVIYELDRQYAAKQIEKINRIVDHAARGSKPALATVNKIANMTIWTLPRSMHGPFIRVMQAAQQVIRG